MRIFEVAPASLTANAKAWIEKVYAAFPQPWNDYHIMPMGGEGADQQLVFFELEPSSTKRGAVEVKWFQAYPQRQGVGSRAMRTLQDMAREDGITLTLYPWKHGRVSQSNLKKFYKKAGYKPINKGADAMIWSPTTEAFDKPYKSKWEKSDYGDVDVLAKLPDGTPLSIMFNHEGDDEWNVEFYRNNSQEVTGEGDAQRIFATVLNAIQKFVKKHKPAVLKFTASKEVGLGQNSQSRSKLYDRLVQRYAGAMGYEAYQEDHGVGVVYELTRLEGVTESNLNEAFDQPYPWKWFDQSSQRQWTATFADVFVIFAVDYDGEWELTFARKNSMAVTGEGDQFKIFGTVIAIAKDFIKLKRPGVLKFSAEKQDTKTKSASRTKLYSAMVRRFASQYGYDFREQSQYGDYTDYILTRKQDESVTEAKGNKS